MMIGKIVKRLTGQPMVCAVVLTAGLVGLSSRAAGSVEYALTYLSVPGKFVFVQKNLKRTLDPLDDTLESSEERVGFGSLGFRLGVGLPARVGPFSVLVEAGYGASAGSQAFNHSEKLVDPASIPPPPNKNLTHVGDITTWELFTIPLLFKLRYAPPAHTIALGGEIGLGPILLGRTVNRTLMEFNAADIFSSRTTVKRSGFAAAVAMEITGGLVVPVTEVLSLHLFGGLLWLSNVSETTTNTTGSPVLVFGSTPDEPGMKLGGVGYTARLSLSHGL